MAAMRCRDCGNIIANGQGIGPVRVSLVCPFRDCPSRKVKPQRRQNFDFSPKRRR